MVNQSKNKFTMKTKYGAAVAPVVFLAGAFVAWSYVRRHAWKKKDESNRNKSSSSSSSSGSESDKKSGGSRVKGVAEKGSDAKAKNKKVAKEVSTGAAAVKEVSAAAPAAAAGGGESRRRPLSRAVLMGAIHGGKVAIQRLLDFHHYHADASPEEDVETEFRSLLCKEQPEFELLQRVIVKMEMKGKEAEGVEILKEALDKARKERKVHEAFEIEMLLVEMLIYKGDIEEASKCKCLEDELITDARRPLYKTIIRYLRGDPENEVVEQFNEFKEIQSSYQWPPNTEEDDRIHRDISTFDEFKKVMELLKKDIEEDNKTTSTRKS